MKDDIKMSDAFNIPVLQGSIKYICADCLNENYNDGVTPFDLAVIAINNHDRLAAENESLKSALTELMNTFSLLADDEGTCAATVYYDYSVATQLLYDLNKQN